MTVKCCHNPTLVREHFAFRLWDHYTCFNGMFPSDSCQNCGIANVAFGGVRNWLFALCNWLRPWDGAMCAGHKEE